jgi:hypothetical protein
MERLVGASPFCQQCVSAPSAFASESMYTGGCASLAWIEEGGAQRMREFTLLRAVESNNSNPFCNSFYNSFYNPFRQTIDK